QIGDDHPALRKIAVERDRQTIAQAVGVPAEGKAPGPLGRVERLGLEAVVVLAIGVAGAGHDAAHEDDTGFGEPLPRIGNEAVLARAAGPHHGNDDTAHMTRWPCRHTVRTMGMPSSTRTCTRSARLPGAISPRSSRPAAVA